jgi:hypothetical protein
MRLTNPAFSSWSSRLVIAPLDRSESFASSPAERRYGLPAQRSDESTL